MPENPEGVMRGRAAEGEGAKDSAGSRGMPGGGAGQGRRRKHGHLAQVEDHIYIYGMSRTYTKWVYHGEPLIAEDNEVAQQEIQDAGPMVINSFDENHAPNYHSDDDGDDGIPELLGDLYRGVDKDKNSRPKFTNILEDAKCALYPGCSNFSKFSFLIKLLHLKSYYRITNTAFDALLQLLSSAFPDNNALPRSYGETKSLLRELGLGYESIHVCENNCVLFWKKYAKLDQCPPRLRRLFMSKETSKNTRWHKLKRRIVENEMRHPSDGEAWKDFDRRYGWFAQDARNLRLGLATDGFNPFGHMSSSYSPNAPGKDFDVFLQPLIQDLLDLWKGIETNDAVTDKTFTLHAAVLWCIHDYPALGTLSGRSTKGYFACVHCDEDPLSQALINKLGYLDHRRYLPENHPWRKSKLFNGKYEKRGKPREFSTSEILEKLEEVKDVRPGKHPLNKKRKRTNKDQPTWHLRVSLWDLPYWSQLKLRHNLDVMHIEKNICENLLWTFLRVEGKTKDTISARIDLENLGIRKELHLVQNGDSYVRPHACYTMTNDQRAAFCKFLRDVKFPDGYAANLTRCVDEDGHKVDVLQRMKVEIPIILCKLEKIYPPAFFDVMVHLAVHLPEEALLRGHVQYGWMYPIERRLCTLKHYVRNRARPEGSIAEAYIVDECLTFCSRYFGDVETRFNRQGRQSSCQDDGVPQDSLSVFTHHVKFLGTGKVSYNDGDLDKLIWYVLNNCEEIDQYKSMYREELERENEFDVDQRLEKGFAPWFKNHIAKLHCDGVVEVSDDIYALSCGPDKRIEKYPSCVANGARYRIVSHEKYRKTQNSSIMTEGIHKDESIDFYAQVFNLDDTKLGKGWKVVQKFEHRHLYDVIETEDPSGDVAYQDDISSSREHVLSDIDPCLEHLLRVDDEDSCRIDPNIVDKIRNITTDASHDTDNEYEDDTLQQYFSDHDGSSDPMIESDVD
ncbi:hypothetical protein U9M48_031056 [Paspalum notatum var. saurae]|uniref:DUF4218 domain-containing protein n=1 Tax=Paspalum notatum var. saurae TaxID=547442 RepID=A0AAQ3U1T7_PASNO